MLVYNLTTQPFFFPLPKEHWFARASTGIFSSHHLHPSHTMWFYHCSLRRDHKSILRWGLFPLWSHSVTPNCISPAGRSPDLVVNQRHRVLPPNLSHLQVWQPVQTVTTGGICVWCIHPPCHTDDTILGDLQLPFYNANEAAQGSQYQITGTSKLADGKHGIDLPDSLGKHNPGWS